MAASWNFVLCPQYVSEIAEDAHRGTLGVFFMMFFNIGYLLIYGIAALFSYRSIAILCLIPSLLFLFLFAWMPETPSNLFIRGKDLEAGISLQWLRGKNANIAEELNKLKTNITITNESSTMSFREMFNDYGTRRGLIIVIMLCLNKQFDGIYIILSYLGIIMLETGNNLSHITASAIVGTLQVGGTILSSYLVDRKGRRFLLIVSNVTVSVCLAVLGAFFYLKHLEIDVSNIGWLPVISLSVYMVGIAIGVSPLPFLVITEVCLPAASKSAFTLGYCILWILSFVMANFFITLSDIIGVYSCFWFLSSACIVFALFTFLVIPETKGRPIQDIYRELSRK
ncbi:facilitated trehalose transporter Tret1 [Anabrus simplex]|uniref:facilitated trehalose transporter Tret1 n=1 Tax=Anabrus simplex TaxID=316456 RepID=UPI0035A3B8E5